MNKITIEAAKLSKRRLTIQSLFRPLSRTKQVEVFYRTGADEILMGLGTDAFGHSLRQARYPSKVEGIFLNYYEVWRSNLDGETCCLDKAYFHLDKPFQDGTGDEELLALHCDPSISKSDTSYAYKRGPHMHISGVKWDISKAHVALCLTNLEHTCSSIETLTAALKEIVMMIDQELLPQFA